MSTLFPTSLDVIPNPTSTDLVENATLGLDHDQQHSNANDAIEALEAKVGVNSSAVTTSLDYKVTNTGSISPGHKHVASEVTDFAQNANQYVYAVDGGSNDTYAITLSPAITSYVTGQRFYFKANTVNTGACTLNINSLGAKTIKKFITIDLSDGDILANQINEVVYDGTNFQLVSHIPVTYNAGTNTHDLSVNGADTNAHGLGVKPKIVKLMFTFSNTTCFTTVYVSYFNGTQYTSSTAGDLGVGTNNGSGTGTGSSRVYSAIAGTYSDATVTTDATNITVTWAKNGSPTGTASYMWEAIA